MTQSFKEPGRFFMNRSGLFMNQTGLFMNRTGLFRNRTIFFVLFISTEKDTGGQITKNHKSFNYNWGSGMN